jgi:hypothetical protein
VHPLEGEIAAYEQAPLPRQAVIERGAEGADGRIASAGAKRRASAS